MSTQKERFWTIPNILSLYRIAMFPVILYFLFQQQRHTFSVLLAINLITDILDGFIARRFNMKTVIGAKIDSWADVGSYILAYAGIWIFEKDFVVTHATGLILFASLYLASLSTVFIRFKGVIGLHLYSCKITGYLQGGFLIVLLFAGYVEWCYFVMIIVGCFAKTEEIITLLVLREKRQNVKSLYYVMKNKW